MATVSFDKVNENIRPPIEMECLSCPHAIWSKSIATNYQRDHDYQSIIIYKRNKDKSLEEGKKSYDNIKCYCKLMFKKTWDATIVEETIYSADIDMVMECEGKGD